MRSKQNKKKKEKPGEIKNIGPNINFIYFLLIFNAINLISRNESKCKLYYYIPNVIIIIIVIVGVVLVSYILYLLLRFPPTFHTYIFRFVCLRFKNDKYLKIKERF